MAEGREDSRWIGKALGERSASCGMGRNLRDLARPSLDIPVRRVICAVIHDERKTARPSNNSRRLPAADDRVCQFAGRGVELLAAAYGQRPEIVGVDLVRGVVVRDAVELV